jgi:diguanylate cyclase (GGDEF)-like protein
MTTRGGGDGPAPGGPAPEIGLALRERSGEICERVVSQWRELDDVADKSARDESDVRRSASAGTLAVADYLVTGELVTRDRSEEWIWSGEAPLMGRITLSDLTRLYVHWRSACEDVIRQEVRARRSSRELLDACLKVLQLGFDVSIVRMARRFEVTRRDLEERVAEQQARLEHQALHDPLTGLANRVLLLDRIEHALESAARRPTGVAVLFMDLDYFKSVNDVSGHSAGDQLLFGVARRLQHAVRPDDTIGRLGGDEFVVLCEDLGDPVRDAVAVAHRIAELFEQPFLVREREIQVAASIGVAPASAADTAERLLGHADHAMYRAKQLGRGRVEVYDPSFDHQEVHHAEMAAALRVAIVQDQLGLVYQPLFELVTRRVIAREALVRWHHPELGDVSPSELIPIAEAAGLITAVGRVVLSRACMDCAAWRRDGEPDVGVSVNVSGLQLGSAAFPGEVEEALKKSGLPPDALTLEVTETLLMADRADARDGLVRVRELGVRIAIDDFGTGYSSLSWLARLPVDAVKVDGSFVAALGVTGRHAAIVDSMIHLAHTLDLDVVAEGVETDAQLVQLARLGCDAAQGFHLEPPAPLARRR